MIFCVLVSKTFLEQLEKHFDKNNNLKAILIGLMKVLVFV
jgi:hypothetical protein